MGRKAGGQLRDGNNERNLLEGASLSREDIEPYLGHAWKHIDAG